MSRTLLKLGVPVLLAGLLAAIPACGPSTTKTLGKIKVAIVTNVKDPFWDICQAGAMKGGVDYEVDVVFKQPLEMSIDKQNKEVENVLQLGLQGLAVSVVNPKEQTPKLKTIVQELPKHNFITIDNDAPDSGRLCYIGVDNVLAGKEVGRLVKSALPAGGTIAVFIGSTDSDNSKKRIGGLLSELAGEDVMQEVSKSQYREKYGNYTFFRKEPLTDSGLKDKAKANAADVMSQLDGQPNLCFIGLYAYNPAKILEAAEAKGLAGKIKIVGFDEDLKTLDGIEQGTIVGSVSQDPYSYGYETVRWLAHVVRDKDMKELPQKASSHSIITKDGGEPVQHDGLTIKYRKAAEYRKIVAEATGSK